MRGGSVFSARIKYAGRDGPARVVRALCGPGQPALPPLGLSGFESELYVVFFKGFRDDCE